MPGMLKRIFTRMVAGWAVGSTLVLAGCGESPVDPTAKRTDMAAEQLRERIRAGQTDR